MSDTAHDVFLASHARSASRSAAAPARRAWTEGFAALVLGLVAAVLTVVLVLFLGALRLEGSSDAPLLSLRSMDSVQAPGGSAAPPPPPEVTAPQPEAPVPLTIDLPDISLDLADSNAPAIKAMVSSGLDIKLHPSQFASTTGEYGMGDGSGSGTGEQFGGQGLARGSMTFGMAELDSQPKLVNRPSVSFPAAQRRRGVTEAKVVLEVLISSNGKVSVKRVLESPHEDFSAMARAFATRALFTPPKKDGRPVNALFRWPLLLKS